MKRKLLFLLTLAAFAQPPSGWTPELSMQVKTIGDVGPDFTPRSYLTPGIRFSLSPDGKSILYPTTSGNQSLWMLEGFDAPR